MAPKYALPVKPLVVRLSDCRRPRGGAHLSCPPRSRRRPLRLTLSGRGRRRAAPLSAAHRGGNTDRRQGDRALRRPRRRSRPELPTAAAGSPSRSRSPSRPVPSVLTRAPRAAVYLPAKSKVREVAPAVGINLKAKTYLHARQGGRGVPRTTVGFAGQCRLQRRRGCRESTSSRASASSTGPWEWPRGARGAFSYSFKPGGRGVRIAPVSRAAAGRCASSSSGRTPAAAHEVPPCARAPVAAGDSSATSRR